MYVLFFTKVDFTSGVSEVFKLANYSTDDQDKKIELFEIMRSEIKGQALMCCDFQVREFEMSPKRAEHACLLWQTSSPDELEEMTDTGLLKGHAYGITAVKRVSIGGTCLTSCFRFVG